MSWRAAIAIWAGVSIMLGACALPALLGDFVYDDFLTARHELFDGAEELLQAFSRTSHDYSPDDLNSALGLTYRPMSVASHVAVNVLFGRAPLAHHLISFALHLLTFGCVLLLCCDVGARSVSPFALAIAIAFAFHPLTGESYLWISGRTDLLAGLALAVLAVLLRQRERGRLLTEHAAFFAAAFPVLAFGALCKEPFLVAAAFLIGAGLLPRGQWENASADARSRLWRTLPALAAWVAALLLLLTLRAHAASHAPPSRGAGGVLGDPAFFARVPQLMALAVETLLLPAPRAMRALSWELAQPWTGAQVLAFGAAVAAATWLGVRRHFRALFLLAGAAATIAPVGAVVDYPWLGLDRYLQMPLILVLVALSDAVPWFDAQLAHASRTGRVALVAAAAAICVWLAGSTFVTATHYRDADSFARALVIQRPADPSGYLMAAQSAVDAGGRAEVAEYLRTVGTRDLPVAFVHAIVLYQHRMGLHRDVERTLERALERFPEHGQIRFDMLELRGAQRRFDEALDLSRSLLDDRRFCRATRSKLLEWEGATGLPEPTRQRLRGQLAAHHCG